MTLDRVEAHEVLDEFGQPVLIIETTDQDGRLIDVTVIEQPDEER